MTRLMWRWTICMLACMLVLCACQRAVPSDENTQVMDDEQIEPVEQSPAPVTTGDDGTGLLRSPFHALRGEAEYIVLGRVVDVQSQSSTVDYVTVAVDKTYRAYGEKTFETVRIHQMVAEDSLADHVGKTCLLFLKKHPADTTDVFYGVGSMRGIMLYDEQTYTLSVYETSFVCDALDEWLMENVSGGETVRVVDIHD